MSYQVREERASDFTAVEALIQAAFKGIEYSDKTEHLLVRRLRQSTAFVPELSLVAEREGVLLGHILLTKVSIVNGERQQESLSLAPVSVSPKWQGQGIGTALIEKAHRKAKEMGFPWIILLGHEDYYPRFGYQKSVDYDIRFPFEAPTENCMVKALLPNALEEVSGLVTYPKAFFE